MKDEPWTQDRAKLSQQKLCKTLLKLVVIWFAESDEETEDETVTHMQEAGKKEEVEEDQQKSLFFSWTPAPDKDNEDKDSFFGWPPSPDLIVPLVLVLVLLLLTILLAWLLHR